MYIKLIQPKMIKRPMDTDIKLHMAPPLGLLTIVSLLREEHTISLENENIQSIDYTDNPDIVGISVTVDTLPRAIRIAKKFRAKGIIVVAGGIHISRGCPFQCDFCLIFYIANMADLLIWYVRRLHIKMWVLLRKGCHDIYKSNFLR